MTTAKTTTPTPTIKRSRGLFAPVAISLLFHGGCMEGNVAPGSEGVPPVPSYPTAHPSAKPSAANLLRNPGFDTDVSGWSVQSGASIAWVAQSDGSDRPRSGYAAGVADSTSRVYQCVPVAALTKFNFGLMASSGVYCDVETFTEADCAGPDTGLRTQALWLNVAWSPDLGSTDTPGDHSLLSFTTTSTDRSARVSCYSYFETKDAASPFFIDRLYLTPSPGGY